MKTKVYAGNEIIAEQDAYFDGTQGLTWKQRNPVTGTQVEQNSLNEYTQKKEYDPFGLELGESDPYWNNAEPDYATFAGGSFYRSGGNPFDDREGCTVDFMAASCSQARALLGAGLAEQCLNNDCGPHAVTVTARDQDGRVIGSSSVLRSQGQAGWNGSLDGTWRVGTPDWSVGGINFNTSAGAGELLYRLDYALHAPIDNPFKSLSDDSPRYTEIASIGGGLPELNSDEKRAAATVASGVEAALQVLDKGCWTPSADFNPDVMEGNRYFANVQNPDKYTKNWSSSLSVHARGVKESPSLTTHFEQSGFSTFHYVLKYYPGQGMAVTADSLSLPHLVGVPGYITGLDKNVNVAWAKGFIKDAPTCKK